MARRRRRCWAAAGCTHHPPQLLAALLQDQLVLVLVLLAPQMTTQAAAAASPPHGRGGPRKTAPAIALLVVVCVWWWCGGCTACNAGSKNMTFWHVLCTKQGLAAYFTCERRRFSDFPPKLCDASAHPATFCCARPSPSIIKRSSRHSSHVLCHPYLTARPPPASTPFSRAGALIASPAGADRQASCRTKQHSKRQ